MIMDFWPWFEFSNFPRLRKKSVNVDAMECVAHHSFCVMSHILCTKPIALGYLHSSTPWHLRSQTLSVIMGNWQIQITAKSPWSWIWWNFKIDVSLFWLVQICSKNWNKLGKLFSRTYPNITVIEVQFKL